MDGKIEFNQEFPSKTWRFREVLFDRVEVMGLKFHSSDYLGTGMTSFQTSGKVFNAQFSWLCRVPPPPPPATPTDFVCIKISFDTSVGM